LCKKNKKKKSLAQSQSTKKKFEQMENFADVKMADKVAQESKKIYKYFLDKIFELCMESARKGNVCYRFDPSDIRKQFGPEFGPQQENESTCHSWECHNWECHSYSNNADVIVNYLVNKGFKVTRKEGKKMIISWKHLLINDSELADNFQVNYATIDIVDFIKKKINECHKSVGENTLEQKQQAKIVFEIYDTVLKTEEYYPNNNDHIFKNSGLINVMLKKLDEAELLDKKRDVKLFPWVSETRELLKKIGKKRGII